MREKPQIRFIDILRLSELYCKSLEQMFYKTLEKIKFASFTYAIDFDYNNAVNKCKEFITKHLEVDEIAKVIRLMKKAINRGGTDNISIAYLERIENTIIEIIEIIIYKI